jgi:hypothetical protein
MIFSRVFLTGIGVVLVVAAVACASDTPEPASPIEMANSSEPPELNDIQVPDVQDTPDFDVEGFAAINPEPSIRELDVEIDLGFYERERLPRDAIEPIYTP